MRRLIFGVVFLALLTASSVFADPPDILKISDIKFGTKAVGFSVFRGIEPEKFDVELRNPVDYMGRVLILARVSGGPLETPLEKIGALSGMSGSPVFVNCSSYQECVNRGVLVGAVSYRFANFPEGGTNSAITPAEDMFARKMDGYHAIINNNETVPAKVFYEKFDGKLQNLLLLPPFISDVYVPESVSEFSGLLPFQPNPQNTGLQPSPELKAGSMISVYLARGDIVIPASGTVTWVDGDYIFAFGHPLFGRGKTLYAFSQISVADTLQTPLSPQKIVGSSVGNNGVILVDGSREIGGLIGPEIEYMKLKVAVNVGETKFVFNEEIAPASEYGRALISALPQMWAQELFGNLSGISLSYKTKIEMANQTEVFLRKKLSAPLIASIRAGMNDPDKSDPFAMVFAQIDDLAKEFTARRIRFMPRSVSVEIDVEKDLEIWTQERVTLSDNAVLPGETVVLSVFMSKFPDKKEIKRLDFPISIPENILSGRKGKTVNLVILVQSGGLFVDRRYGRGLIVSPEEAIEDINEKYGFAENQIYVQVITLREDSPKSDKKNSDINDLSGWRDIDPWIVSSYLKGMRKEDVELHILPPLGDILSVNESFELTVGQTSETVSGDGVKKERDRLKFLKFWRWF